MRSNRDTKLENIMESMYTPAADVVKENDEDTGRIPHDVDSFGTGDGMDDIHQGFERRELVGKVDRRIQEVTNGEYNSLDEWLYKELSELQAAMTADGQDAEAEVDGWINRWIERAVLQQDADR